jgi:hypothetical protein
MHGSRRHVYRQQEFDGGVDGPNADSGARTSPGAEAHADTNTDSGARTSAGTEAHAHADTNTDAHTGTGPRTRAETDADARAHAGTRSSARPRAEADTDAHPNAGTGTGPGPGPGPGTNALGPFSARQWKPSDRCQRQNSATARRRCQRIGIRAH